MEQTHVNKTVFLIFGLSCLDLDNKIIYIYLFTLNEYFILIYPCLLFATNMKRVRLATYVSFLIYQNNRILSIFSIPFRFLMQKLRCKSLKYLHRKCIFFMKRMSLLLFPLNKKKLNVYFVSYHVWILVASLPENCSRFQR